MRIKSDFKDYYDVAQSYGQDLDFVYFRYKKEVDLKDNPWHQLNPSHYNQTNKINYIFGALGFCGKIYPFVKISTIGNYYSDCYFRNKSGIDVNKEEKTRRKFCFSLSDVESFVVKNFPNELSQFKVKPSWGKNQSEAGKWTRNERHFVFKEYFEFMEVSSNSYKYLFEENHTPIFSIEIVRNEKTKAKENFARLKINDELKKFDFFRVFEPNLAYQEISSFLGGLAVPNKPIPIHGDELKAEIHGFDKVYSFRQPAIKKKHRSQK